jgi:hypothetical protein
VNLIAIDHKSCSFAILKKRSKTAMNTNVCLICCKRYFSQPERWKEGHNVSSSESHEERNRLAADIAATNKKQQTHTKRTTAQSEGTRLRTATAKVDLAWPFFRLGHDVGHGFEG